MDTDALIESIYEAPFDPSLWMGILEAMSGKVGARGGILRSYPFSPNFYIFNDGLGELIESIRSDNRQLMKPIEERLLALPSNSFQTDLDLFPMIERQKIAAVDTLFKPNGMTHSASNRVETPWGQTFFIALMRATENGPMDSEAIAWLNTLRPHLARAITLATRHEFQQVHTTNQALGAAGLAAAALDKNGRVIDCNPLFANLKGQIDIGARDQMHVLHAPSETILMENLRSAGSKARSKHGVSRSLALPATGETPAAILHLIPSGRLIRELFTGIVLFAVVTPIGSLKPVSVDLIESLFDLTVAEARVAHLLAQGSDVNEIAKQFDISKETVRKHLKSIFSKTGFSRQAELSATIAGLRAIT